MLISKDSLAGKDVIVESCLEGGVKDSLSTEAMFALTPDEGMWASLWSSSYGRAEATAS